MNDIINGVSEVVITLNYNYLEFSIILLLNSFIFYFLFKKYVYDLLDPLSYLVLSWCIQISILIYITIFIEKWHTTQLIYVYIANVTFFLGFFLVAKKISVLNIKSNFNNIFIISTQEHILFLLSVVIFLISKLLILYFTGIQIGTDDPFSYYRAIPLGGLLIRLLSVTSVIIIVYSFLRIFLFGFRHSKGYVLVVTIVFLLELPSAGKSLLLKYLYYLVLTQFIYSLISQKKFEPKSKFLLFLGICSSIIILFISSGDLATAAFAFFYRIIMFADIYMFILAGDVLDYIDIDIDTFDGLIVIIKDLLGFFRLYDWSELPKELGNQIFQYVTNSDTLKGPNPLHVFFGLFYFGWFGILFSFLIGLLLGVSRTKYLENASKSFKHLLLYIFLFTSISAFSVDPSYGMLNLVNLLFIYFPIYLMSFFIKKLIFLKR